MSYKMLKGFTAIAGILLSACAATPSTHFYVLEAMSQPSKASTEMTEKRTIGIGPVTLPALLERKQIVTRAENNGVQIAEFHQWAAPLKNNVVQVLTQNLAKLQPDSIIRSYPWSAFGTVNHHIVIDITRFDTQPGKSAHLEATWAIMEDKSHALVSNGQSKIEEPLTDPSYTGTALALSKILDEFSRELSLALGKLK